MQNITLTQLTVIIAAICMVSFFVNAGVNESNTIQYYGVETVEISSKDHSYEEKLTFNKVKLSNNKFIFSTVDQNNNGELSYQEVLLTKSQWLLSSFSAIDTDTNDSITEKEIVDFAYK
jgi:hypothetical protein